MKQPVPKPRRGSRGSVVAMAMAIVLLLLVVGGALAVVSTLNLNLAAREEYAQRAEELARAGIDQFLVDMDAGFIDNVTNPTTPSGVGIVIQQNFVQPVTPNPLAAPRQQALTDPKVPPYPMSAFHGDGACYISFVPNNAAGVPWSTWNADNETPTPGYGGRLVPAFAVDVIATARVGGVTRHLAVHAVRRWSYAIAAAQEIFLTTAGGYPTTVEGDIYSRSQGTVAGANTAIHVGYPYDPSVASHLGPPTSGSVVNGRLLDTNPNPASINVSPGNHVLSQQSNYRLVKFPDFEDVAIDNTWTDLTHFTRQNPAPDGSFLIPNTHNGCTPGERPTWYLDNSRGGPMQLVDGKYYVDGNLSILGPSQCTGLQLTRSQLKVKGSLVLTRRPTAVYGIQSALSVNRDFTFKWGFLSSDQDTGFVISADRLVCEVGGDFHGLAVVRKGIYTSQLNLNDLQGSPVADGADFVSFPEGEAGASGCCQCGCTGCFCQGCGCMSCCRCGGNCCTGCGGSAGCGSGCSGCGSCGDVAPCAGTYHLSGCCTGPAFSAPMPNPESQYVNPTSIAAVAPPGMKPLTGGSGIAYPLHITGALLAPYNSDIAQGYPLIVSSISVTWDPVYLKALNQHAPVQTRSWEVLP